MRRGIVLLMVTVIGLLAMLPASALAQRTPPHVFVGSATINGVPAPFGAVVAAWTDGVRLGGTVVRDGRYTLLVEPPPGDDIITSTITFTVSNLVAGRTTFWKPGGATVLNLTTAAEGRGQPPHVFVGVATINGVQAADGTVVRAWAYGFLLGTAVVNDGRYTLLVTKPGRGQAITFTVGESVVLQRASWVQGAADILNLSTGGTTLPTREALKPLGPNLVRIFHFDHTTGGWIFYDPRPSFNDTNTLAVIVPGQEYLLQLFDDQVLTINGTNRHLSTGLNRIIW